jgi:hypothetical protein
LSAGILRNPFDLLFRFGDDSQRCMLGSSTGNSRSFAFVLAVLLGLGTDIRRTNGTNEFIEFVRSGSRNNVRRWGSCGWKEWVDAA